jgi:hypothetical protein
MSGQDDALRLAVETVDKFPTHKARLIEARVPWRGA